MEKSSIICSFRCSVTNQPQSKKTKPVKSSIALTDQISMIYVYDVCSNTIFSIEDSNKKDILTPKIMLITAVFRAIKAQIRTFWWFLIKNLTFFLLKIEHFLTFFAIVVVNFV